MAPGACDRRFDVPLIDKILAVPHLIEFITVSGFPIEVKNLLHRANLHLGMAMTFQAPAHALRLILHHRLHVIDIPVAADATDAAVHVDRVIEIDVVGDFVNPHPVNRLARAPTVIQRRQLGAVFLDLRVAVHTSLGVGNVGMF